MSDAKVQPTHLRRPAVVYVRQSTAAQVEHHRESTRRQYDLTERARQLGWRADQITVIDEDLGLSGATTQGRSGFARMTAQVALGHVAFSSAWRSRGWPATTPTGTGCSTCAA